MFKNIYKIAEKTIEISSVYEDVHNLCRDYRSDGVPDFTVETGQIDFDYEREKSAEEYRKEGRSVRNFPDSYLETLAVYRKFCSRLIEYDTILFHGSVVAVDGEGYLFTAKSGTGKSTHTKLWRELFGNRAVMVNDDKPLIKILDHDIIVYGTPWDGKHRISTNISVPLRAICILQRGQENHIEKISRSEAFPMLLQQVNRPADVGKMQKTLQLTDRLAENAGLYRLNCNMDIEAAIVAYNGMKGN